MPIINGISINDSNDLKEFMTELYSRYNYTQPLQYADYLFFVELLKYHPKYNDWHINPRDINIIVKNRPNGNVHTILINKYPFSPYMCFEKPHTQQHKISDAFRNSIRGDIVRHKKSIFRKYPIYHCMLSGLTITLNTASTHHVTKFELILKKFLNDTNLDINKIQVIHTDRGYILKDKKLTDKFRAFHHRYPLLILHETVHSTIHAD